MTLELTPAMPPASPVAYQKAGCPVCGGSGCLQVTWREANGRYLLRCWNCPGGASGRWLGELARTLDTNTDRLLRDPFGSGLIVAKGTGGGSKSGNGSGPDGRGSSWGSFPSEADIWRKHKELLLERSALKARRWLARSRLIDRDTIRVSRIGWSASTGCIVVPLYDSAARLANVKMRRVGKGQMRSWPGMSEFPLFPWVPEGRRVVLVAGELDALALVCRGIPAVSVTAGAGTWLPEYARALRNKRVTVCFDRGEEAAAEFAASQLKRARVHHWNGAPPRYDPTKFLRDGGDPRTLVRT